MSNKSKVIIALATIGLLSSSVVAYHRIQVQNANDTAAISMTMSSVRTIALASHQSVPTMLSLLQRAGLTSVAVQNQSIGLLAGRNKLYITSGSTILRRVALGEENNPGLLKLAKAGKISKSTNYIFVPKASLLSRLQQALRYSLPHKTTVLSTSTKGPRILAVKAPISSLVNVQTGISKSEVSVAEAAGLSVLPRVGNVSHLSSAQLKFLLHGFAGLGNHLTSVAFTGIHALGFPHHLSEVALALKKLNVPISLIWFYPQHGTITLARDLNYNAVRLFSISSAQEATYGLSSSISKEVTSINERGIRIAYLHAVLPTHTSLTLAENLKLITGIRKGIVHFGYRLGNPKAYTSVGATRLLLSFAGLAGVAGGLWFLDSLFPKLKVPIWYALAGLGVIISFSMLKLPPLMMDHVRRLLGTTAGLGFSMVAMLQFIRREKNAQGGFGSAVVSFLRATVISLMGALTVVGLTSGKAYLLELDSFFGVKLLFIVPVLLFAVFYALVFKTEPFRQVMGRLWQAPIRIKHLITILVVLFVAVVYISRTGNHPIIPVTHIEIVARRALRNLIGVRPRTKEFLLGDPGFILGALLLWRKKPWLAYPFLLLGAIAQADMVDTFAHTEIPITLSFMRTLAAVVIGIALAYIGMWVLRWLGFLRPTTEASTLKPKAMGQVKKS